MIRIRYTAPRELDLSGSVEVMRAVRQSILTLIETEGPDVTVEASTAFDPAPYDEVLCRLVISRSQGPVKVEVTSEREVHVSGSTDYLKGLASCLDFPAWTTLWTHTHVEYFEGHPFLTSDSIPLVVSVE